MLHPPNSIRPCRSVDIYQKLNRIEEGTYGIVYRARDKQTGDIVALKRLKLEREREGFPVTSLREINTLMTLSHSNIVGIREMVVGRELENVFIVMDYIDHDLRALMDDMPHPFHITEVKTITRQLLSAIATMHEQWILHRDLKTSNLLLSNRGEIKVADFGLARHLGEPQTDHLTTPVVTLWYRAPELLLGSLEYDWSIDIWSAGCIMAELLSMKPIFPGKGEIDQLDRIFKFLGVPTESNWPGFSKLPHSNKIQSNLYSPSSSNELFRQFPQLNVKGLDLLSQLLSLDPKKRPTAKEAMEHEWFNEYPLPKDPSMFPTWPSKSSGEKRINSNRTPEAPNKRREVEMN